MAHLERICRKIMPCVTSMETPGRRNAADVPPRDVTPASFHETQGNAGAVKIDTDDLNLYMLVQLQDF